MYIDNDSFENSGLIFGHHYIPIQYYVYNNGKNNSRHQIAQYFVNNICSNTS